MRYLWMFAVLAIGVVWGAYEEPSIRVRLVQEVPQFCCEVRGGYKVINEYSKELVASSSFGKKFLLSANIDGISWGEVFLDMSTIRIIPQKSGSVYVNGIQYRGDLVVVQSEGRVTAVNEVPIEDFLKSTLSHRTDFPQHKESLAAWVMIERTKVMNRTVKEAFYHVDAESVQYYGYGVTLQNALLEEAIDLTKYIVLKGTNSLGEFSATQAELLEHDGLDAKAILSKLFPHHTLCNGSIG